MFVLRHMSNPELNRWLILISTDHAYVAKANPRRDVRQVIAKQLTEAKADRYLSVLRGRIGRGEQLIQKPLGEEYWGKRRRRRKGT